VLGVLFCIPGTLWMLILSRWKASVGESLAQPAAATSGEEGVLEGRIT
jgi:hypothetical protein